MANTQADEQPAPKKGDDADSHYCGYACTHEMGRDDNGNPILCGAKCSKMVVPGDGHQQYGTHRCVQHH